MRPPRTRPCNSTADGHGCKAKPLHLGVYLSSVRTSVQLNLEEGIPSNMSSHHQRP